MARKNLSGRTEEKSPETNPYAEYATATTVAAIHAATVNSRPSLNSGDIVSAAYPKLMLLSPEASGRITGMWYLEEGREGGRKGGRGGGGEGRGEGTVNLQAVPTAPRRPYPRPAAHTHHGKNFPPYSA